MTNFLTQTDIAELRRKYGLPLYVYSSTVIQEQAKKIKAIPAPFGITVRYAMKANPYPQILRLVKENDIKIDASSAYEATRAMEYGFDPQDILLTSQQLAHNLLELVTKGVQFTACSLHQLEAFGKMFPDKKVSVRINPGMGSGHSQKTNVGGVTSSFGIWHEYIPKVEEIAQRYSLTIERIHTHIGSGTDLLVWEKAVDLTLEIVKQFPQATIVNIGGGFKVGRMNNEPSTEIHQVGELLRQKLQEFANNTDRELHLEVEPGTFLVANAGILMAQVEDIVDTGSDGYRFIKLNVGMTELLRPSLYAAQHPIAVVSDSVKKGDFVVVGHCCESGDLFTPSSTDPEQRATRHLAEPNIGDVVLIGGCGAYAASMAAHGYNSFPQTLEVMM